MNKVRTWLAIAGGAVLAASPALAGDIATFQSIGFSQDGSIYAFEEFGIQDGSGFPYSNIFLIDTVNDTYLAGTPIRVRLDVENAGLSQARAEAMKKARPLIDKHDLFDNPGDIVAFNPVTELDSASDRLRYRAYPADPAFGNPYALKLESFKVAPTGHCIDMVDQLVAFRLKMTEKDGTPANDPLHEDKDVPTSRGCTTGYRLGGVVTYAPIAGSSVHMALVQVFSAGFEGNDGRWIAVPVRP